MKIEQMDTTKEAIKATLEIAAEKAGVVWYNQQAHKIAVGIFCMDAVGMTEAADRKAFMTQWLATPASFGCNASAMGQQLGREKAGEKLVKVMADF